MLPLRKGNKQERRYCIFCERMIDVVVDPSNRVLAWDCFHALPYDASEMPHCPPPEVTEEQWETILEEEG